MSGPIRPSVPPDHSLLPEMPCLQTHTDRRAYRSKKLPIVIKPLSDLFSEPFLSLTNLPCQAARVAMLQLKSSQTMASQAQTDANRRNSQKSTGPRTDAGKAASSQNAT